MAKRAFDCVELQHQGGDRIYEATKGMTHEELVAWWAERDKEFLARREARRAKCEKSSTSE